MNDQEIKEIQQALEETGPTELIETHISWVILTPSFAFKFKKPVKFSFLDFSTLQKRHFFCKRELLLNRRLSAEMYLDVVTVRRHQGMLAVDTNEGDIIDYAVKMKRIAASRQMNVMLDNNSVTADHMDQVADVLSTFHVYTDVIEDPPNIETMYQDYADILAPDENAPVGRFIEKKLGNDALNLIKESVSFTSSFLKVFSARFVERGNQGFVVDGHGDLHSKNIFLLDQPMIFDCIEFNDHFRQLDVLDELAFFCMDLDLYDRDDLAQRLMLTYEVHYPCILDEVDVKIFQYYKLYRANVKIKVNALKALQAGHEDISSDRTARAANYFDLFQRYFFNLKS